MAIVTIENLGNKVIDLSACQSSLLHCLLESGLDWMHSCGGKGRCTTCKVQVQMGMEHITPVSPAEMRYRKQGALLETERLSCQVRIRGDVSIRVPEESKLPHLKYTDTLPDKT